MSDGLEPENIRGKKQRMRNEPLAMIMGFLPKHALNLHVFGRTGQERALVTEELLVRIPDKAGLAEVS